MPFLLWTVGCVLESVPGTRNQFTVQVVTTGQSKVFDCANGTVFDQQACVCVNDMDYTSKCSSVLWLLNIKNSLPRKLNSVCFLVICNPFNDYCYNVHFTCDGDRFTLVSYSDWYLCGHCQYVTAFSETHCSTNETDNTNFSRPTRPYNETSWV